jgi:hypothetical protein
MPVEPTEMNARREGEETGFEDQPTEVQMSPLLRHHDDKPERAPRRGHADDEHTTQKRGPEMGALLAKVVIEDEGDGDSDNSATEINTIKPGGTPARPPRRAPSSSDGEGDPTLIHARVGFPKRRGGGARRVPSSPDDTIKMTGDLADRIQEARERLAEQQEPVPAPDVPVPRPNKR